MVRAARAQVLSPQGQMISDMAQDHARSACASLGNARRFATADSEQRLLLAVKAQAHVHRYAQDFVEHHFALKFAKTQLSLVHRVTPSLRPRSGRCDTEAHVRVKTHFSCSSTALS